MCAQITPFAEKIVSLLPPLWAQSGEEHLMKQAILAILTRLINSMKEDSRRYQALILPLIDNAVRPGSDMQVYLLDDALDLWAAVLVQTAAPASSELLSLAPHLFAIFELGSENVRKALEITESYLLLAPAEMLRDEMRNRLFASFTALLDNVKASACGLVTHLMEVMVRAAESLGGESATKVVASGMVASGFINKVMDGLRANWRARQTTGPNRTYPPLDDAMETDYLGVLARLSLASPQVLMSTVRAASPPGLEGGVLDEWFHQFGNMGDPVARKLNCLALTRLLETRERWILSRMQDLMTVWTDVVKEMQDGTDSREAEYVCSWPSHRRR